MRILHATTSAETSTLGIERQVATLAVAQKASGSDVMIAIDRPGVFTESCRESGVWVTVCDQLRRPLANLAAATPEGAVALEDAVQGFIEFMEKFSPDIIHCHNLGAALVAIGAGNRVNIPCVFTGDGWQVSIDGWRRGLRFATLCLNAANFKVLLKSDIPDAYIYYVPNGTRAARPERERQPGAAHTPSLMVVGELDPRKGIDVLILAMVQLRRRLGRACPVLNIYGDGARKAYLAEMAAVLGLDDVVIFHGFQPDVMENCPSDDILVMSSRGEAGPQVVLEAMSRGMPIVATDVGDVANMLPDRRYGRVVPWDSVMPLANAMESLLQDVADGRFDPDLVIERHRSEYSIEKLVERTEAVYSQLLNNSATTGHSKEGR
jgi:glycosyltransferase involved in cell wall biosynthesis